MRHDFLVTRWVLVLAALVATAWLAVSLLSDGPPRGGESAPAPSPPAPVAADPAPRLDDRETELLAPDIQALWRERRRRLDELSRRYRAATDAAAAEALRCSMETLIARSEREVHELRLAHARRAGQDELVRRLERALVDLPAKPESYPDTNATPVAGPGGPSP